MLACSTKKAAAVAATGIVGAVQGIAKAAMTASALEQKAGKDDAFATAFTAAYMPAYSYTQNLAGCIWKYGGLEALLPSGDGAPAAGPKLVRPFCLPPRCFNFYQLQGGCASAIAHLTDDATELLRKHKELQRYRLCVIGQTVAEEWSAHGGRVADPYGGRVDDAIGREGALAHQLCEWAKDGYSEEISTPETIRKGA